MNASDESTLLSGWKLRAARALWIIIVVIAIATYVVALPVRYAELTRLMPQAERAPQQLSPDEFQVLKSFRITLDRYALLVLSIEIGFQIVFTTLGVLIFVRDPRNWVAFLTSLGLVTYAMYVAPPLDAVALPDAPLDGFWYVLANFVQAVGLQIALTFFYVFPDGRFTPRWTIPLIVGWTLITWMAFLFPNVPWNFLNPWTITPPAFFVLMVWWATGLLAQFVRLFRVNNQVQRQQSKWVVYSVTFAVLGYAVAYIPRVFFPGLRATSEPGLIYDAFAVPLFYVSVLTLPFAITFSILRYRLWDIDSLISNAVIYGALTIALLMIYAGSVLLLQQLFRTLTGAPSALAIVISTTIIALLFNPLRQRAQAAIDRRLYRRKYDAVRTLEKFSVVAREEVDLNRLTTQLISVVQEAMQPEHVSVWLKKRGPS